MCRPSCCNKSTHEGAGIVAVAVIAAFVFVAVKIGPIVARILHVALEVLTIITLTAAAALACLILGWLTSSVVRWRNCRHYADGQITLRPAPFVPQRHIGEPKGDPDCLACGDTGTVLRAISGSRYQARPCPACEPATRAG
jgi:hypothetical protein